MSNHPKFIAFRVYSLELGFSESSQRQELVEVGENTVPNVCSPERSGNDIKIIFLI